MMTSVHEPTAEAEAIQQNTQCYFLVHCQNNRVGLFLLCFRSRVQRSRLFLAFVFGNNDRPGFRGKYMLSCSVLNGRKRRVAVVIAGGSRLSLCLTPPAALS